MSLQTSRLVTGGNVPQANVGQLVSACASEGFSVRRKGQRLHGHWPWFGGPKLLPLTQVNDSQIVVTSVSRQSQIRSGGEIGCSLRITAIARTFIGRNLRSGRYLPKGDFCFCAGGQCTSIPGKNHAEARPVQRHVGNHLLVVRVPEVQAVLLLPCGSCPQAAECQKRLCS